MRAIVYIDGFNLYYGALKTRWPHLKWLDLSALASALLPGKQVVLVRYFTALIIPPPHDPDARVRQETYLRALRTFPNISVHDDGWFVQRKGRRYQLPLAYPKGPGTPPQSVYVQLPEEKGSDVNLASFLLLDCFQNAYDEAVIISNDADLKTPIKIVTKQFGKHVGVINPHPKKSRSAVLASVASWTYQTLNKGPLEKSQLPPILTTSQGTRITKPASW